MDNYKFRPALDKDSSKNVPCIGKNGWKTIFVQVRYVEIILGVNTFIQVSRVPLTPCIEINAWNRYVVFKE